MLEEWNGLIIEWLRHAADPTIDEAGGTPNFVETSLWRPLLAPGPFAKHVLSRPEPWGCLDSLWRPFWAHFGELSPILGHVDYLTYGPHCHFIFLVVQ